jgi:PAS domain S-box-containing protein
MMPAYLMAWLIGACVLVALLLQLRLYVLRRGRAVEVAFAQLLQLGDVGLIILDEAGLVIEWSPALAQLTGLDRAGMVGRDFLGQCVLAEDLERLRSEFASLGPAKGHVTVEFTLRGRQPRQLRWRLCFVQDPADGRRYVAAVAQDVSDLRETIAGLQASEARFRQVFQSAPVAMALAEAGGRLLVVNQEYANFLGYESSEALIGRSLLEHTLPDDHATLHSAVQEAREGGSYRLEMRFLTRAGEVRWGDARGLMLSDDTGQPYLVSQIADVHERKQAELQLTQHRNQLLVAQRIARLGAWQWDFASRRLEISDVFREMLKCPPGLQSLDASTLEALVLPEDAARVQDSLQELVRSDQKVVTEVRARTFQGEWRYWRVDITIERDEGGHRRRLLGTAQDITESRLTEVALRQSEARYRSLFDTNLDGLYFMSLGGLIEEANPAFLSMLAWGAEDIRGVSARSLTPEDWAAADDLAGNQIRAQGYCDILQKEVLTRDGRRLPVAFRAWQVCNDDGDPLRVMGMVRDITALKKVEAEREALQKGLQQAQKMEAIGQLTGGIAHDFNNILASILGYTELALQHPLVAGDAPLQRQLHEVRLAGERARELIRQMLLFSRGGRRSGLVQPVAGLIEDAVRMLQPTLPASLLLRTRLSPELPGILMDGVALQQVVMNLVINARDAMGAKGEVELLAHPTEMRSTLCASCHHRVAGSFVEVAVSDHGPGIGEAVLERIFDPFFSTKPVGQGSGMGLSVVHGIVHEFGGHILVESDSGGSKFRMLFPRPQRTGAAAPPLMQGHGEHILVVDDEAAVADMLGEILRSHGYSAEVATDSRQALTRLQREGVDLLLTDLFMPQIDGVALAQKAQQQRPGLPVVMLSGQAALLASDGLQWPVLAKPVDIPALLGCLEQLLEAAGLRPEHETI